MKRGLNFSVFTVLVDHTTNPYVPTIEVNRRTCRVHSHKIIASDGVLKMSIGVSLITNDQNDHVDKIQPIMREKALR